MPLFSGTTRIYSIRCWCTSTIDRASVHCTEVLDLRYPCFRLLISRCSLSVHPAVNGHLKKHWGQNAANKATRHPTSPCRGSGLYLLKRYLLTLTKCATLDFKVSVLVSKDKCKISPVCLYKSHSIGNDLA